MTHTTHNSETVLAIADWRLDQIEITLEQDIEPSDIVNTCRYIIDLSDDEIVEEDLI